ncbi:MAG: carbohydrate kinase family protein [Candidatus Moraniibacteriota bacterium]
MAKIICIGSAAKDIFFPTGEGILLHTPEDIEAQEKVEFEVGAKYQIDDRYEAPGGVAANGAIGLARLGVDVACYSQIGSDQIGDWVVQELEKEGVRTDLLVRDANAWTDLSAILVFTQTGDRTIFFNRDANEHLKVNVEELVGAEYVFVSALNGDWQTNLRTVLALVRDGKAKLILNPGQRNLQDDVVLVAEAAALADILVLNKDEAIALLKHSHSEMTAEQLNDETELIRELHTLGAKRIGLTDGLRGAWVSDNSQIFWAPASGERATDTTGAGDAFGSGFVAALLQEKDIETALRWATANAGNVIRYYGAQQGLLRTEEIGELSKNIEIQSK